MSENEKEILERITKKLPMLSEVKQMYILGRVEALAEIREEEKMKVSDKAS